MNLTGSIGLDPVTQGVVGLSASQLVSKRRERMMAAVLGVLSGMAADLDVLIKSPNDPLLYLEYHRHFTHALIFIPFGALFCALLARFIFRKWFAGNQLSFSRTYLFCLAGYATHAVLDACTTYGTQLFWPFSNARVAWNNVSVIDPLFTVPLILLMLLTLWLKSSRTAWFAAVYAVSYLGLGVVQNKRAISIAQDLANSRGHYSVDISAKPSFANLIVWKSVYEYQDRYYVDAIRILIDKKIYPGTSIAKLSLDTHFPWLDDSSQQARDVERFRWFSNQYLSVDPENANRIIDVRYSMVPNRFDGMWGIVLSPTADKTEHVAWTTSRRGGDKAKRSAKQLWLMIKGQ